MLAHQGWKRRTLGPSMHDILIAWIPSALHNTQSGAHRLATRRLSRRLPSLAIRRVRVFVQCDWLRGRLHSVKARLRALQVYIDLQDLGRWRAAYPRLTSEAVKGARAAMEVPSATC